MSSTPAPDLLPAVPAGSGARQRLILKAGKRLCAAALLLISFLAPPSAQASNDWVNFATVSMTDPTHAKLTSGYGCRTDGKDILCDSATSAVTFGTGGLLDMGGLTVNGSVSITTISTSLIQLGAGLGATCSAGINGAIRYAATSNTLEICTGSAWTSLASGTITGNGVSGGSATAIAFWNGPSSLTYESATTSGLYWDHTNSRLGIGTNAPGSPLVVSRTGGGSLASFAGTSPSTNTWVSVANGSVAATLGVDTDNVGYTFAGGSYKIFTGGANERLRVDSGGNVGIATQSPTATLQVSGTFTVSNSAQGATAPSIMVTTGGLVGVGTSAPAYRLEVRQQSGGVLPGINIVSDTGSARASIGFGLNAATTTGWIVGQSKDQTQKDFYIYDVAKGLFRMVFDTSGSIGIGTATPGSSLTVVGGEVQTGTSGGACVTATNGGAIRYSAGTLYYCNGSNTWASIAGGGAGFTGGGSATAIAFWNGTNSLTYESATTSGLYWDHTNGRLGIGTNVPSVPLTVSGGAIMSVNANADRAIYMSGNGGSGTPILQGTNGNNTVTQHIAIQPYGGNVSVGGFASPTATLQVSGSMIVSTTGQNTASAASLLVDSRGVSVSSIVHISGSPISPIGAGGNTILSGTTAVSTSSAGSITFYTSGNQVMAINPGGSVGIGIANPQQKLQVNVSGTAYSTERISNGVSNLDLAMAPDGSAQMIQNGAYPIQFFANGGERMRIDSSGNVGIGTTAPSVSSPFFTQGEAFGSNGWQVIANNGGTNGWAFMQFVRSGVNIGSINQTGTTGVAYNQSSDRRVKENITNAREGLQKLMQIGVKDFAFRADPSHTIINGFIAQDLNKVYPEAVTTNGDNGEVPLKDKSKIWQVDYGRVTPLIVKAVQDLKHLFDTDHEAIEKLRLENETLRKTLAAANDNIQALQSAVKGLQRSSSR